MKQTTLANQVALAAAGARPCAGTRARAAYALLDAHRSNANGEVGMSMSWPCTKFATDITTKHPARHLGGHRTT